jgi:hypothetical protein
MPSVFYTTTKLQEIGMAEFGQSASIGGIWVIEHWLMAERNYQFKINWPGSVLEIVLESDVEAIELKLRFS